MIKIPNNGKFSQTNQSDLFGNIYYSKSINFDEEGYLKLSNRSVSLRNEITDTDFNIPTSFGASYTGENYIGTVENAYILTLSDNSLSALAKDAGAGVPSLDFTNYGKWYNKLWYITNNTKMYYKTPSTGAWTDTGITLTTAKFHPLCDFKKGTSLLVGNGNLIQQLSTSHSTANLAQLTLSADYEIIGIAYNNNMAGIGTRNTTTSGQKEAQFFTWDGSASSANSGYGVGATAILDVIPYKSSFLILNNLGQLLYFNGGGFDTLASFPIYFKDVSWQALGYGDMMQTIGDVVFINTNSIIIDNHFNSYLESFLGGIWCYDPNVGLYHRQAPSISTASILSCEQAGVDLTTNKITVYGTNSMPTSYTIPTTGNPIKVLDTSIAELSEGTIYYIIKASATEFKLATTKQNALDLIAIDLTTQGGATSYFMTMELRDYGQSNGGRNGGVGLLSGKAYSYSDIIFGGEYQEPSETSANTAHLNLSVYGFKNIGYFITPKIVAQGVEDNIQKLYIKYRPLNTDDKIKIKYKNKDFIGIPELASCTATSNKIFTTTSKIPNSYAYIDELECEIIGGAGAGQMSKIVSITESSGTYTITLSEEMEGITAGNYLNIKIDNWAELQTITEADSENWKEIALAKTSKWTKFKVVLEGSETTIEEFITISTPQLKGL